MTIAAGTLEGVPPIPRRPAGRAPSVAKAVVGCLACIAVANVAVPLGAVAAAGLTAYLLKNRQFAFVTLLLLCILTFADSRAGIMQPGIPLRYPVVVVVGMFALFTALKRGVKPEVTYFLPFVAAALIGLALGGGGAGYADGLLKTISYLLLVSVVFQFIAPLVDRAPLKYARAVWRFYAFVIFASLAAIVIAPSIAFFIGGRYRGIMGNPDGMGGLTCLILPFEMAMLEATPRAHRRAMWVLIAATILSSVLSGSRGSLVGMLIFFLARAVVRLNWRGRAIAIALAGIMVSGAIKVAADPAVLNTPALAKYVRPETLESGSGRFFAWAYAMDFIRTAPWFGRGFGFDEYIFDEEHRETVFTDRGGHQGLIHNAYLGIALDAGIVGVVLYLGFIAGVVKRSRAVASLLPLLAVVAWSCIVEGWAVSSLNAYTIIFYIGLVFIPRLAFHRQPPYRPQLLKSNPR